MICKSCKKPLEENRPLEITIHLSMFLLQILSMVFMLVPTITRYAFRSGYAGHEPNDPNSFKENIFYFLRDGDGGNTFFVLPIIIAAIFCLFHFWIIFCETFADKGDRIKVKPILSVVFSLAQLILYLIPSVFIHVSSEKPMHDFGYDWLLEIRYMYEPMYFIGLIPIVLLALISVFVYIKQPAITKKTKSKIAHLLNVYEKKIVMGIFAVCLVGVVISIATNLHGAEQKQMLHCRTAIKNVLYSSQTDEIKANVDKALNVLEECEHKKYNFTDEEEKELETYRGFIKEYSSENLDAIFSLCEDLDSKISDYHIAVSELSEILYDLYNGNKNVTYRELDVALTKCKRMENEINNRWLNIIDVYEIDKFYDIDRHNIKISYYADDEKNIARELINSASKSDFDKKIILTELYDEDTIKKHQNQISIYNQEKNSENSGSSFQINQYVYGYPGMSIRSDCKGCGSDIKNIVLYDTLDIIIEKHDIYDYDVYDWYKYAAPTRK